MRPDEISEANNLPLEVNILSLSSYSDQWSICANLKEKTAVVFLDVEMAFDHVWHGGHLHKLHQIGIALPILSKLIKSFLENRIFKVRQGENVPNSHPIIAVVPQGSCLSPTLYLVFTNDMPKNPKASISLFADDTLACTQTTETQKGLSLNCKNRFRWPPPNKRRENYRGCL